MRFLYLAMFSVRALFAQPHPVDSWPAESRLAVDSREFRFSLSNGTLTVKLYNNAAMGFISQPEAAASITDVPNIIATAMKCDQSKVYPVVLDSVSMTLNSTVCYTFGAGIDCISLAVIYPEAQQPLVIQLRDEAPNFVGVRPVKLERFRHLPLQVGAKKVSLPLLPSDAIRTRLFTRGTDVRIYYVDLNDFNQDEDGYFQFSLHGQLLKVVHYGQTKMHFSQSFERFVETIPPHPFQFFVASGDRKIFLETADFAERGSAIYLLPAIFEALEIHSLDENTFSSLYQRTPSIVRNSGLSAAENVITFRRSTSDVTQKSIVASTEQINNPSRKALSYSRPGDHQRLQSSGSFEFALNDDHQLKIQHHTNDAPFLGSHTAQRVLSNPDFTLYFEVEIAGEIRSFTLRPEDFVNGMATISNIGNLPGSAFASKSLRIKTTNVNHQHPVFFTSTIVELSATHISCSSSFERY